jgi:hypothetical protein
MFKQKRLSKIPNKVCTDEHLSNNAMMKERNHLGDLRVNHTTLLKLTLKKHR